MRLTAARTALLATCLLASLTLTGCGSDDSDAGAVATPDVHYLRLAIADSLPPAIYYNWDDRVCYLGEEFTGGGEAVDVTIKSGDGTILATAQSPTGEVGEFQKKAGCLVYFNIKVPESDFYEVTLSGGNLGSTSETETVEFEEGDREMGTRDFYQQVVFDL